MCDFRSTRLRRNTRQGRRCIWAGCVIKVGDEYAYTCARAEGSFTTFWYCLGCLREAWPSAYEDILHRPRPKRKRTRKKLTPQQRAALPLLAFKVTLVPPFDDEVEIVFARTPGEAKTFPCWSTEYDWTYLRVTRAPEFDGCSDPPTAQEYIERGWTYGCAASSCSRMLHEDDNPVFRNGDAYCRGHFEDVKEAV